MERIPVKGSTLMKVRGNGQPGFLPLPYDTAGNLFSGAAGRLRCKVIRHPVNDEKSSDDNNAVGLIYAALENALHVRKVPCTISCKTQCI